MYEKWGVSLGAPLLCFYGEQRRKEVVHDQYSQNQHLPDSAEYDDIQYRNNYFGQ
jgi:hypothetical protein